MSIIQIVSEVQYDQVLVYATKGCSGKERGEIFWFERMDIHFETWSKLEKMTFTL